MSEIINELRFYNFITGVLLEQQTDPLCRDCKAFENTVRQVKGGLAGLEDSLAGERGSAAAEMLSLLDRARGRIDGVRTPEGAVGQKKAGRCRMPEGVCFIKLSKSIREKIRP